VVVFPLNGFHLAISTLPQIQRAIGLPGHDVGAQGSDRQDGLNGALFAKNALFPLQPSLVQFKKFCVPHPDNDDFVLALEQQPQHVGLVPFAAGDQIAGFRVVHGLDKEDNEDNEDNEDKEDKEEKRGQRGQRGKQRTKEEKEENEDKEEKRGKRKTKRKTKRKKEEKRK